MSPGEGLYTEDICMNEINSLEYGTLKLPYELLNKKFRVSQKSVEEQNYFFNKEFTSIEKKLRNSTNDEPIKLQDISENLDRMAKRVTQFNNTFTEICNSEIQTAGLLKKRAECLVEGISSDPEKEDIFRKLRLDRFIVDHLLRAGYFETAEALIETVDLEMRANLDVFRTAKEIEQNLAKKNLYTCFCWIVDNRSKLHRLRSTFETEIRIQYCAELINTGRQMEAISYAKKFFSKLPQDQWKHGNLLILFGLLGFGQAVEHLPKECTVYKKLLSPERYQELIKLFRHEFNAIFQLNTQSAFSACLHAGLAAHKTPCCKRNLNSKCIACNKLYDLAEGLPVAHEQHSKLICANTGEPLNEENQPLMLPNGRVFGENAIRSMICQEGANSTTVRCPKTGQTYLSDEIKRVYVL